ncbi:MAG: FG-GAP repeat protein, partial [Salinispira sp.]
GTQSGSAYIFTRSGSTWTQQAKLLASDGDGGDYFGCSVAMDGNTTIVGAYGDNDNGTWSGSAYIFTRSGSSWESILE